MWYDTFLVVKLLVEALDRLKIPYLIGGSVASSIHGVFRYTNDVDFVIDIDQDDVLRIVEALKGEFYVDDEMITEALVYQSSFSVLHLEKLIKADFFIKKDTLWADEEWRRRRPDKFEAQSESIAIQLPSPEDTVLHKLEWFNMGGGVSDRQWNDVLGVLKLQAGDLDIDYLRAWANRLGLSDLLEQAIAAIPVD